MKAGTEMPGQKEPTNNRDKVGKQRAGVEVRAGSAATDRRDCILIIEDNALNMKLFRDLLRAQGYQVLEATDGLAGLDLARAETPDLILLDIHLPDVSGLEVAVKLKAAERTRDIPILVITASLLPEAEQSALSSGCDAFLRKPIAISEFRTTVASLLKEKRICTGSEPTA
jgi:two-component system cell cycle response regulator DivK